MSNDANGSKSKKAGLLRRFFRFFGALARFLRTTFNILFLLLFIFILASMFGGDVKSLPQKAFLRIAPAGALVEQLTYSDPFAQLIRQRTSRPAETLMSDLLEVIDGAADDPRITGLVLELDYLESGGITKLQELGVALNQFKTSGKRVVAIGDNFTQAQYYLASFADEIHLNPMGVVTLTGYGAYQPYFKEAFEKLGINFHVFKVGEYKDAVEPFTRNDMSSQARAQTESWLNELWLSYTAQVEGNRRLPANTIDNFIDQLDNHLTSVGGDMAELARNQLLIDHVSTRPEMLHRMQTIAGMNQDEKNSYLHIDHQDYLFHRQLKLKSEDKNGKVGLLVASGTIYDGERPEGDIGSHSISTLLQTVREEKRLDALVIRIDSPGGSAFASDIIRQEIELTQKTGIPVVVSMGSLAASGGYWIAAGADELWAAPTTLTGSIGVFGLIPTFENTLDSLGIHSDGVGTSSLADSYRLDRPMSTQAKKIIQANVQNIYDKFITLVAAGRDLSREQVEALAQGKVWTGRQAQQHGLVDKIGTLKDALNAAAHLANLKNYDVEAVEQKLSFPERILKQIARGSRQIKILLPSEHRRRTDAEFALRQKAINLIARIDLLPSPNKSANIYLDCIECRAF